VGVDDFDATYDRMTSAGVEFLTAPRTEAHGRFAVFLDVDFRTLEVMPGRRLVTE